MTDIETAREYMEYILLMKSEKMKVSSKFKKAYRELLESVQQTDPLLHSIWESPRIVYCKDDDPDYYEICMVEPDGEMSDNEFRQDVLDRFEIPMPNSPYDCTGRPFTAYLNLHKNPNGRYSIVHRVCYDL